MRNHRVFFALLVAAALGTWGTTLISSANATSPAEIERFEYWVAPVQGAISGKRFHEKNKAFLDSAGAKGWELVSVDTNVFYFKRPKVTSPMEAPAP